MFGRRKRFDRTLRERGVPPEVDSGEQSSRSATTGPFDIEDVDDLTGFVDFGALKMKLRTGFDVRLEMGKTGELNGITLVHQGSVMQLGVFAAPRSGGAWESIREDIVGEISRSGGKVSEQDGPFGPMLVAMLNNAAGPQPARFLGVDGPRWFVRALIAGPVAQSDAACEPFYDVFRGLVIERGTEPKPVREPIILRLPPELAEQMQQAAAEAQQRAAAQAQAQRSAAGGAQPGAQPSQSDG